MAKPWEKYSAESADGPWAKYSEKKIEEVQDEPIQDESQYSDEFLEKARKFTEAEYGEPTAKRYARKALTGAGIGLGGTAGAILGAPAEVVPGPGTAVHAGATLLGGTLGGTAGKTIGDMAFGKAPLSLEDYQKQLGIHDEKDPIKKYAMENPDDPATFGHGIVQNVINTANPKKLANSVEALATWPAGVADIVKEKGAIEGGKESLKGMVEMVPGAMDIAHGDFNFPRTGKMMAEGTLLDTTVGMEIGWNAPKVAKAASGKVVDMSFKGVDTLFPELKTSLMERSLKIPPSERGRNRMIQTALDGLYRANKPSLDKLYKDIDNVNAEISFVLEEAQGAGKKVPVQRVLDILDERIADASYILGDAEGITSGIKQIREEVLTNEHVKNGMIDIADAQKMKISIYRKLRNSYGEMKGFQVETSKAIARGLKEGIAEAAPELKKLNEKDSRLIQLEEVLFRSANRIGNRDLMGLGVPVKFIAAMAYHNKLAPAIGIALGLLDTPQVKARLALALQKASTRKLLPGEINSIIGKMKDDAKAKLDEAIKNYQERGKFDAEVVPSDRLALPAPEKPIIDAEIIPPKQLPPPAATVTPGGTVLPPEQVSGMINQRVADKSTGLVGPEGTPGYPPVPENLGPRPPEGGPSGTPPIPSPPLKGGDTSPQLNRRKLKNQAKAREAERNLPAKEDALFQKTMKEQGVKQAFKDLAEDIRKEGGGKKGIAKVALKVGVPAALITKYIYSSDEDREKMLAMPIMAGIIAGSNYSEFGKKNFGENAKPGKPATIPEKVQLRGQYSELGDKQLRFLLSDKAAEVNKMQARNNIGSAFGEQDWMARDRYKAFKEGTPMPLPYVIEHQAAYDLYPQLRELKVQVNKNLTNSASLNYKYGIIMLPNIKKGPKGDLVVAATGENIKQFLIHEIQHKIQRVEGFAEGGAMVKWRDHLTESEKSDLAKAEAAGDAETIDMFEQSAWDIYRELLGEEEARRVSERSRPEFDEYKAMGKPFEGSDMKGKEKSLRVKIGGEIVKSEGIPRGKLDRVMKFNSRELSPSEIGALKLWRTDMHEPSAPKNSNFSESTGLQVKNQPHLPSGKFWSTRKEGSFISGGLNDGFGNRRIPGKELKAESKEFWDEVYVSVGRPTKGSKIVEVNESLLHNLEYEGMTKSDITNYFKENGVDFVKIPSVELSGKLTEIIQLMPERVKVRGKRDGFYVVPIALISNVISSDKN